MYTFYAIWIVVVNIVETILIYYLIIHKLSYIESKKRFIPFACFFRIVIQSILNLSETPFPISPILVFSFDYLFVCACFQGTILKKILLIFSYFFIAAFAEIVTASVLCIIPSSTPLFFSEHIGVQGSLCYLLAFCIGVMLLTYKDNKKEIAIPTRLKCILFNVMALGVILLYKLIDQLFYTVYNASHINLVNYLAFCILFLVFLVFLLVFNWNLEVIRIKEHEKIEQQQYFLVKEQVHTLRVWKHDFQSHLTIIQELAKSGKNENLIQYIAQFQKEFIESISFASTGNPVLDAILSSKLFEAQKNKISFDYKVYLPDSVFPLDDIKFATLLSNLLDNAFEACSHVDYTESPFVFLSIKPHYEMLYLEVRNSSSGIYQYDKKGKLLSIKSEPFHGMGLKLVQQIVNQANGFLEVIPEETTFTVKILFQNHTTI